MTSTNTEFHVPGAYTFDNPPPFPAPRPASPPPSQSFGADVFRPPVASPSPSGSAVLHMAKSSSSLVSDVSMTPAAATPAAGTGMPAKRKRPATDSREGTPLPSDWGHMSLDTTDSGGDGRVVYTLAGQIDSSGPRLQLQQPRGLDDSVYAAYADVDYRRALGPGPRTAAASASVADGAAVAAEDRWTVLQALGSVVGKVWEFCTAGAFRGFHAGGGAGYDWETGRPTAVGTGDGGGADAKSEPTASDPEWPAVASSAEDRPARSATPTTPTQHVGKRRHVASSTGDELARSWVMVQPPPDPRSARRTTTGAAATPSARSRTATTTSGIPRGASPARVLPSGSNGSSNSSRRPGTPSRRISTPVARRGASGVPPPPPHTTPHSRLRVSHAGSPGLQPREPASFASPRSPAGAASAARSPIPATASHRRGARAATLSGQRPLSRAGSPVAAAGGGGGRTPRAHQASSAAGAAAAANPFARGSGSTAAGSRRRTHQRSHSSISSLGGGGGPRGTAAAESRGYDDAALAASPRLTDEAKRLAAQQRAADQDADEKMEAFNRRLQEMIRQGQEALGTRFEVDDDGEGEGDGDQQRAACFWADE